MILFLFTFPDLLSLLILLYDVFFLHPQSFNLRVTSRKLSYDSFIMWHGAATVEHDGGKTKERTIKSGKKRSSSSGSTGGRGSRCLSGCRGTGTRFGPTAKRKENGSEDGERDRKVVMVLTREETRIQIFEFEFYSKARSLGAGRRRQGQHPTRVHSVANRTRTRKRGGYARCDGPLRVLLHEPYARRCQASHWQRCLVSFAKRGLC